MKNFSIKTAFRDTVPVLTGYVVLGMGFGVIMNANGYGVWWALAMSVFVYAGSMQYAAVGLLTGGASIVTVALTTLAVNARHLFYGISMLENYKSAGAAKPYLIFALTDETYSLVCGEPKDTRYCLAVSLLDHSYWVIGTAIGAVLGNVLHFNTTGIDFALTALFIIVFVDQWLSCKQHFPAILGVLASIACVIIFGADRFLIPAMIVILLVLLPGMKREVPNE